METRFKVGDRVRHRKGWTGTVLRINEKAVERDVTVFHPMRDITVNRNSLTLIESASDRTERLAKESQYGPVTAASTAPEPSLAMIAAMCLQGLLASGHFKGYNDAAEKSVNFADALLAELQKPKP